MHCLSILHCNVCLFAYLLISINKPICALWAKKATQNHNSCVLSNVGKCPPHSRRSCQCYRTQAGRSRDALCQSKSARLLHNSRNKLYNTNPQQIEVTKSELFGQAMCKQLCRSSHDALTVVSVINKLDRRRVSSTTRWTCRDESF